MNPDQIQPQGGTAPNAANNALQPPVAPVAGPSGSAQALPAAQQPVSYGQPAPPVAGNAASGGQPNPGGVSVGQAPARNPNSTQNTLLIKEVRDGMAIMSDGSMRAAVACQSINFDLMSSREREGVEFSYQSFLNSLYFPVQVLIRSQRVDIGPYLERLSKLRRDQDNMLLGVLMDDYINFIDTISAETNIMDKQFYIIVPYYPAGDPTSTVNSTKNLFSGLFSAPTQSVVHIQETAYQKAKEEIQNRCLTVINGLMQMGVRATRLDTKQYSELFYNFYNPDTAVREPLGNFDPAPAVAIRKGQGNAAHPYLDREMI